MIPEDGDTFTSFSCESTSPSWNGTPPHAHQTATLDTEEPHASAAYRRLKAGLDAYEVWAGLDVVEQLIVILEHYDAMQWLEPDALAVLAHFRHMPTGKWAQIKLRYKQIGGHPHDLQCAVDTLLKMQPQADTAAGQWTPLPVRTLYAKDLLPMHYIVQDILPIGATLFV